MPPTVADRILHALSPALSIRATRITILKPIVKGWHLLTTNRGQKRCQVLENVAYVIETEGRACSQLDADANAGTFHLGLADFQARLRVVESEPPASDLANTGTIDLGWLPHSISGTSPKRMHYFPATIVNGVLDLTGVTEAALVS